MLLLQPPPRHWETMPAEPNIPVLPAFRLGDLAEAMGVKTHVTGLPAWEKKHESLCEGRSSDTAPRLTVGQLESMWRGADAD